AADALSDGRGADLAPDGELLSRLEEIRRATSVSEIWLYDQQGVLLGGATTGNPAPAVPSRVRIGPPDRRSRIEADPGLRVPTRDAAGGLSLLVPLATESGAGALLARLDRESQGGLATVDFLFQVGKGMAGVLVAAGFLALFRWVMQGPAPSSAAAVPSSDVDMVLGTVREVMTTLKDSETEARDRVSAAEADAERWRRTSDLIVRSIGSGIVAFDPEGRVTIFNAAAETLLGRTADTALGRPLEEVLGPGDPLTRVAAQLRRTGSPPPRFETGRPAGEDMLWLGVSSSVLRGHDGRGVGGILLVSDLTETQRLRDQMKLKDRLSAVGEMSAGMTHEMKNSLHALMGSANLLREDYGEDTPVALRGILDEVASLESLVKGILEFSRPSLLVKAPTDLNVVVRDIARSVEGAARERGVAVEVRTDESLPEAPLDAEALRRAFLNLALNAVEAMDGGGTLTLATRTAERPGEEVRVSFRDTGPGVPESDRDRIFTPFYTTKRDGSGLGLALVHKTVTDHGGRLTLLSREGVGTEFVVTLPKDER
ncbi:MAG: PAS domain-containing protein, partial [Gemmatimonadetes bacterium]|nr:PAS domain-containing protein [Gemmatimonadota bacterium]